MTTCEREAIELRQSSSLIRVEYATMIIKVEVMLLTKDPQQYSQTTIQIQAAP